MAVQRILGSDIVMIFDECTPYPADFAQAAQSMRLSLRWAERSKQAHGDNPAALFGIVQGGVHASLRQESAAGLRALGFDGYAIGGLSVGEPKEDRARILEALTPHLPGDRPRTIVGRCRSVAAARSARAVRRTAFVGIGRRTFGIPKISAGTGAPSRVVGEIGRLRSVRPHRRRRRPEADSAPSDHVFRACVERKDRFHRPPGRGEGRGKARTEKKRWGLGPGRSILP